MTKLGLIILLLSSLVACNSTTDKASSQLGQTNHPTSDCANCHSVSAPTASTAVGAVAATATTPGWKFYHTTASMNGNDCLVCHTNTYAGQAGGWAHGTFGARHSAISSNCKSCHQPPTAVISAAKQTPAGRSYTIRFHNIVPTNFNEDPGAAYDCSSCHAYSDGFTVGNFGPQGSAHLTDSLGNQVSRCVDCHNYPADFPSPPFPPGQHSMPQSHGYDCGYCHLKPGNYGATKPGGFGDL